MNPMEFGYQTKKVLAQRQSHTGLVDIATNKHEQFTTQLHSHTPFYQNVLSVNPTHEGVEHGRRICLKDTPNYLPRAYINRENTYMGKQHMTQTFLNTK